MRPVARGARWPRPSTASTWRSARRGPRPGGESGCGKTTLARAILGLQPPTSGEIRIDGRPVDRSRRGLKTLRRQAQLVSRTRPARSTPARRSTRSWPRDPRIHRLPDERAAVAEALARSGLRPPERFFLRYPHELSGGQRQRVVIAGAMACRPELLVADEPVSSLDASVRGEILRLLLDLVRHEEVTVLVVTHDLGLAWNIADRIAVMYLGRIVEIGPAADILESPQHPYTRALLSVVPEAQQMEQEILIGEAPDPTRIPAGCRFHPRCPLVRDGQAEALGVGGACQSQDVALAPTTAGRAVACHAVALSHHP